MGSSISAVSLSCVNCKSGLNTIEDLEGSWKLQSKELKFKDEELDLRDEFTVFRSHIEGQSLELSQFSDISKYKTDLNVVGSRFIGNGTQQRCLSLQASPQITVYKTECQSLTEVSTPHLFQKSKMRTFSRNYSLNSRNLVESVRKGSC